MSQTTKRWSGFLLGAVCTILALGGVYYLKSGERGQGTPPSPVSQTTARSVEPHPIPSPVLSSPTTPPNPALLT
ncbi:MAG TPA: hypothetical protein PKH31_06950, partial [Candidatus Sumerlaeota bacterium]|nr:hypothetical protein [Candidatus Sumerlaeota bacterium]